jgi:hypothetical protein
MLKELLEHWHLFLLLMRPPRRASRITFDYQALEPNNKKLTLMC